MQEVEHHGFQVALAHLAVRDAQRGLGHDVAQAGGHLVDRLHAVVYEEDLAAARQFLQNRRADQAGVEARHVGAHRLPIDRRGLDHAQVAQAHHAHIERARNGRGRQGQHVHLVAQAFDLLLVRHPEAVFFVHHDQPQRLEPHVALEQAMRADHDVHLPARDPGQHGLDVRGAAKAVQRLDPHRVVGEAARERLGVLLGQNRRRHQHRDLPPAFHGQIGGAQRDLGLAVAHVAAHQPVHGFGRLQVGHDVVDGGALAAGLLERKTRHELLVAVREVCQPRAFRVFAHRVQFEQFARHGQNRLAGAALDALPRLAAQPVERRRRPARARVFLDEIDALDRHVHFVAAGVFQVEIVARGARHAQVVQPVVLPDAVVGMHHVVAGRQLAQAGQIVGDRPRPAPPPVPALAEHVLLGEHDQPVFGQAEPVRHLGDDDRAAPPVRRPPRRRLVDGKRHLVAVQQVLQVFGHAGGRDRQTHAQPGVPPTADLRGERGQALLPAAGRARSGVQPRGDRAVRVHRRQAAYLHPHAMRQRRFHLVRGGVGPLDRRHEAAGLARGHGVRLQPVPHLGEARLPSRGFDRPHHAVVRDVVRWLLQRRVEIGQQEFDARKRQPALDVFHEALPFPVRHLAGVQRLFYRAPRGLQAGDGKEPHGQHHQFVHVVVRALRGRRERPHGLDRVAQKLDADRPVGQRWEQIDDAAAHADLALFLDQRHAAVPPLHAVFDQFGERKIVADPQPQGRDDELFLGQHALQQGLGRGDQHRSADRQQVVQPFDLRGDGLAAGRHALGRGHVPCRIVADARGECGARERAQVVRERLGVRIRGQHAQAGPRAVRQRVGHEQGLRGALEPGHAQQASIRAVRGGAGQEADRGVACRGQRFRGHGGSLCLHSRAWGARVIGRPRLRHAPRRRRGRPAAPVRDGR